MPKNLCFGYIFGYGFQNHVFTELKYRVPIKYLHYVTSPNLDLEQNDPTNLSRSYLSLATSCWRSKYHKFLRKHEK